MEDRDDYPIIPQPENKTDEFRLQNYRAMENKLLSANSDVKRLNKDLASLKEVVKQMIPIIESFNYKGYNCYQEIIDRAKRISDNK